MKNKLVHYSIILIFCSLYFLVATISMINSVAFFDIAHEGKMNWVLAVGFELGAAASLAAIIILDKTNRFMVWFLFILLTLFQMMANSYHAFVNLENYLPWIELFGLENEDVLTQKRILSFISGAVLPIVALGFIKSLVDYIKPDEPNSTNNITESNEETESNGLVEESSDIETAKKKKENLNEELLDEELLVRDIINTENAIISDKNIDESKNDSNKIESTESKNIIDEIKPTENKNADLSKKKVNLNKDNEFDTALSINNSGDSTDKPKPVEENRTGHVRIAPKRKTVGNPKKELKGQREVWVYKS